MKKEKNNKKKQDLGIYYTPEIVVDFIFDILNILKNKEDKEKKRWQSRKPQVHYPSVVDPACGEGIFLKKAVESGFTKTDWVFGIDIDASVVKQWPKINLLKMFKGDKNKLKSHFFHQDGLGKIQWEQHKKEYYGKLKQEDIENEIFSTVVGNPPYGGLGVEEITPELEKALAEYEIWKILASKKRNNNISSQGLFGTQIEGKLHKVIKGFAIEILFLERFIQLAKPGGWIAVIVPDGILANSTNHYVREFIARNTKVLGIISLPRDTFTHTGTNAKTSILFLEKLKEKVTKLEYPVFLASINELISENLDIIAQEFKEFVFRGKLLEENNG